MTNFLTALAIVVALLVAALVALRFWMAQPHRVFAEIAALPGLSDHERDAIADCLEDARHADDKTWPYDLSAPIVMLLVLLFVKRGANQLPRLFSKWDNNVSLNGDGEVVRRGDRWVNLRDIGWTPEPGEQVIRYDDPRYDGDAYYAPGHHPRSFWARYVWLGLRNRASQRSVELGRDVTEAPQLISGRMDIGTRMAGHFLLRQGDTYHYKSIRKWGPFALIRSYGYKLEIRYYQGPGRAAATAIGRSLKRWKGPR
jgi:hypothetical protein